jgi:two-component system LytT family response regulator/two-component system response regulator LytT
MSSEKIKVIIADDELRALNRMKILLGHFDDIEIVAQTTDSSVCIDLIIEYSPDLIFLDIEMPGKTGLEITDDIKKNFLNTKVVFVTSHEHYAVRAIKNEVFDYILKPVSIDELKSTISRYSANVKLNLSKREREIIQLISKGLNSESIGKKLHISRHTVDTHRRSILEKTNCSNAAELITFSLKSGLI